MIMTCEEADSLRQIVIGVGNGTVPVSGQGLVPGRKEGRWRQIPSGRYGYTEAALWWKMRTCMRTQTSCRPLLGSLSSSVKAGRNFVLKMHFSYKKKEAHKPNIGLSEVHLTGNTNATDTQKKSLAWKFRPKSLIFQNLKINSFARSKIFSHLKNYFQK